MDRSTSDLHSWVQVLRPSFHFAPSPLTPLPTSLEVGMSSARGFSLQCIKGFCNWAPSDPVIPQPETRFLCFLF